MSQAPQVPQAPQTQQQAPQQVAPVQAQLPVPTTVEGLLVSADFTTQIQKALPATFDAGRFAASAQTLVAKIPKLAKCSLQSFQKSMLDCATLGLYPDGRLVHLLPYGSTVQTIVDYKGLVKLMLNSGKVSTVNAEVVYEADHFTYENGIVDHKVDFRAELRGEGRGLPFAAYCKIVMVDGSSRYEVMGRTEILKVKASSKSSSSGPWKTWEMEMWKKTVVRRASKYLDLTSDGNMDLQIKLQELEAAEFETQAKQSAYVSNQMEDGAIIDQIAAIMQEKSLTMADLNNAMSTQGHEPVGTLASVPAELLNQCLSWATRR